MDGAVFADDITIANFQSSDLPLIFLVLRVFAQRSKLEDAVLPSYAARPFDDNVRPDRGPRSDFDIGANDGERANTDILSKHGGRIHDRGGMDQAFCSAAAHMISALATNSPSTSARHSKAQIFRLWRT